MAASEVSAALDEVRAKYEKFFAAGDMTAVSELYTEDCRFLAPGMAMKQGRKAVAEALALMKTSEDVKVILTPTEIDCAGDLVYEVGEYSVVKGDGTVVEAGKALVVFKKIGSAFFLHVDCFNSDGK